MAEEVCEVATRASDEYPYAIQAAGPIAMRVFDYLEQSLIEDGYSPDDADMLMQINIDQVIVEAQHVAKQEAQADARRDALAKRASKTGRKGETRQHQ
jgi:hypothetical protein